MGREREQEREDLSAPSHVGLVYERHAMPDELEQGHHRLQGVASPLRVGVAWVLEASVSNRANTPLRRHAWI